METNYLIHHGVKGQKWGVRRYQNYDGTLKTKKSLKGNIHRALAANYGLNERTYKKMGNNTLASMNASAKKQQLAKAEAADAKKNVKRQQKLEIAKAKGERKVRKAMLKAEAKKIRSAKVKSAVKKTGIIAVNTAFNVAIYKANKNTREWRENYQYRQDRREAQEKLTPYSNEVINRKLARASMPSFGKTLRSAPKGPYAR